MPARHCWVSILLWRFWQVYTKLQLHPKHYARSPCTTVTKSSEFKAPGPRVQPRNCRGEKKATEGWANVEKGKVRWRPAAVAVANDIARYFHRKILNIRNELDGIDVTQNRCSDLIDDPAFSSNLEPLRVFKDLYQLIQASAKKSCMLDPFKTSVLLGSLEELLPIITSMVDCSLALGHFPAAWKAALVDPQLKKPC